MGSTRDFGQHSWGAESKLGRIPEAGSIPPPHGWSPHPAQIPAPVPVPKHRWATARQGTACQPSSKGSCYKSRIKSSTTRSSVSAAQTAAPARPRAGCEQPLQAASPTSLPAAIPPDNGFPAGRRRRQEHSEDNCAARLGERRAPEQDTARAVGCKAMQWSPCLQAAPASGIALKGKAVAV